MAINNNQQNSIIELCHEHLSNNVELIKEVVGKETQISAVIKGNAYGHGLESFIQMAETLGLNHFAVSNASEARKAHSLLHSKSSLMVMGIYGENDVEWMIEKGVEFYIENMNQLQFSIQKSKELKRPSKIHLEVETGTHRTGFEEEAFYHAIELIQKNETQIELYGLTSQLSGAGKEGNEERVAKQYDTFDKYVDLLHSKGLFPKYIHIDSSISTLTSFKFRYNMVRIGTSLYGIYVNFHDNKHRKNHIQERLRRVMCWKSFIFSIKEVEKGKMIGYGAGYLADRNKKIALLPIGYFDGYRRNMPKKSYVLIREQKAKIIGLVNMNSIFIDVTDVHSVAIGDEVILMGLDSGKSIDPESFFEKDEYVNGIEFPCRLHPNIPRIIT